LITTTCAIYGYIWLRLHHASQEALIDQTPCRLHPMQQCRREGQCLTLFADIKLWIPQKASSYRKMRTEALEVLHATKITLPGTPLSLVLCATAPRLSNHNTGLHPVDSDHENFTCMSRWLEVRERRTFFALLSQDCIPCAGWPDKSLCHSRTPSEDRHAMHTILPRLEKEKDVEPSWESCSFSLSRFAIPSAAKEE
jgi:hypothetical protein